MGLDVPNTTNFSRALIVAKGDVSIESGDQNLIAIGDQCYYLKGSYVVSSVRVDVWNGLLFVNANENVKLILRPEVLSNVDVDTLGNVAIEGGKYPNIRVKAKGNACLNGDFGNIDATVGGNVDIRGSGGSVKVACGGCANVSGSFQGIAQQGCAEEIFGDGEEKIVSEDDEGLGELEECVDEESDDEECGNDGDSFDENDEVEECEEDDEEEDAESAEEDADEIVEKDFSNVSIDTSGDVYIENGEENLISYNGEYYRLQGCYSLSEIDVEVSDGSLTINGSENVTLILQTERLEQLNIDSSGDVTLNDGQYKNVEINTSGDVNIADGQYDDLNIDASGDVKINGTFGDVNIDTSGDVTIDGSGASLHVDTAGECVNNGTFAYLFGCN